MPTTSMHIIRGIFNTKYKKRTQNVNKRVEYIYRQGWLLQKKYYSLYNI